MARFVVYATFFVSPLGPDSIFPIETSAQEEWFDNDKDDRFKHDKRLAKRTNWQAPMVFGAVNLSPSKPHQKP